MSGMQHDGLADRAFLPFRMDPVGVAQAATREVLEPLEVVEATAILADLREPRVAMNAGSRNRLVARQAGLELVKSDVVV